MAGIIHSDNYGTTKLIYLCELRYGMLVYIYIYVLSAHKAYRLRPSYIANYYSECLSNVHITSKIIIYICIAIMYSYIM